MMPTVRPVLRQASRTISARRSCPLPCRGKIQAHDVHAREKHAFERLRVARRRPSVATILVLLLIQPPRERFY